MGIRITRRRLPALLLLALLFRANGAEPVDELKSATVLVFLRMAEWRGQTASSDPITVGVVGRAALVEALNHVLSGKMVDKQPIRIVNLNGAPDGSCCRAVYVALERPAEVRAALASRYAAHALTIGESERFLDYGGSVNLFLVDGRISFEASLEALDKAGVAISSKLLRLGQIRRSRADRSAP